ncbi:unnamed protein product, partial [Prorocentrum cordatum]
ECLLPPPPPPASAPGDDMPPFAWPRTVQEIESMVEKVVTDAKANLDAVAALPESELTFEKVIRPLMEAPNFKTNPLVCQAKHLQHCSTDASLREAASKAATAFAACKKDPRRPGVHLFCVGRRLPAEVARLRRLGRRGRRAPTFTRR